MIETVYVGDDTLLTFGATPLGYRMYLDTRDLRITPDIISGIYEDKIAPLFFKLLSPGDCVLDVGANVGYYSLSARELVGQKGFIVAMEPNPRSVELLRMNVETNELNSHIAVREEAASDRPGVEEFWSDENFSVGSHLMGVGSHSNQNKGKIITVSAVTLDSIAPESCNVIKMDVEGAEYKVWKGMTKMLELDALKKVFLEFHNYAMSDEDSANLLKSVQDWGFVVEAFLEDGSRVLTDSVLTRSRTFLRCVRG